MFKKKVLISLLATTASIGMLNGTALACSRILLNSGQEHVVGRTMDIYMPDHARLIVYPRGISRDGGVNNGNSMTWVSKYGSVTVNSLNEATSDGINEKGLVANLLYLHETQYEARDHRPGISNASILLYLLDTSATVAEALAEMQKVQVVSTQIAGRDWPLHISISDADGDSAVIEFVKGSMVVHQGKDTNVMTNEPPLDWQLNNLKDYKYFGGSKPLPGDIDPASRFVRASAFLKSMPTANSTQDALAKVYSIVKTVSVPAGAQDTSTVVETEDAWPTLWATLADSRNKLYFFQASDSPNMYWIDLSKVNFSKGRSVTYLSAYDISLNGEVSNRLKPLQNDSKHR